MKTSPPERNASLRDTVLNRAKQRIRETKTDTGEIERVVSMGRAVIQKREVVATPAKRFLREKLQPDGLAVGGGGDGCRSVGTGLFGARPTVRNILR
jgi:hypothetical protein